MSDLVAINPASIPLRNRVQWLRWYLNRICLERKQAIDVMLASAITGLGVCLYGPPGTGKTMIAELIAKAIDGKYAYVLGNPTMKPSSLTGVPDMRLMREESKMRYNTEGTLFDSHVAVFDEVGKAPAYAKNLLLRAMNEGLGPNNESIPMVALFMASNEPINDSPAFLDRIVASLYFDDLVKRENRMLLRARGFGREPWPKMPEGFLDPDEIKGLWDVVKQEVSVSEEIEGVLELLECKIYYDVRPAGNDEIHPHRVSTRKSLWIGQLLRSIAWLRGMNTVSIELMKEIYPLALWKEPGDREKARKVVEDAIESISKERESIIEAIKDMERAIGDHVHPSNVAVTLVSLDEIEEACREALATDLIPRIDDLRWIVKNGDKERAKERNRVLFRSVHTFIDLYTDDLSAMPFDKWVAETGLFREQLSKISGLPPELHAELSACKNALSEAVISRIAKENGITPEEVKRKTRERREKEKAEQLASARN